MFDLQRPAERKRGAAQHDDTVRAPGRPVPSGREGACPGRNLAQRYGCLARRHDAALRCLRRPGEPRHVLYNALASVLRTVRPARCKLLHLFSIRLVRPRRIVASSCAAGLKWLSPNCSPSGRKKALRFLAMRFPAETGWRLRSVVFRFCRHARSMNCKMLSAFCPVFSRVSRFQRRNCKKLPIWQGFSRLFSRSVLRSLCSSSQVLRKT